MRSGFTESTATKPLEVTIRGDAVARDDPAAFKARLQHDNSAYGQWKDNFSQEIWRRFSLTPSDEAQSALLDKIQSLLNHDSKLMAELLASGAPGEFLRILSKFWDFRTGFAEQIGLSSFLIYTPTEEALRDLSRESHIEPIGLHGEGLFKLLSNLTEPQLAELQKYLRLIHWFDGLQVLHGAAPSLNAINIVDQYLDEGIAKFDQRSANEGFLFLLLYAALLVSSHTPKFFAIDNVDTALNPKLSAGVIRMFVEASKQHDRQVLLTTHNPGALDGLDVQDPEQRLFVVYRNLEGRTRIRRIQRGAGENLPRLSEAFLQGNLGGLPNHF